MNKNKTLSIVFIIINIIGIFCLLYCTVLYLSHSTYVINPDAMIPMENLERGGMLLTIGLVPMLLANTFGFWFILKEETVLVKRLLFFIPSVFEMILVINYWI